MVNFSSRCRIRSNMQWSHVNYTVSANDVQDFQNLSTIAEKTQKFGYRSKTSSRFYRVFSANFERFRESLMRLVFNACTVSDCCIFDLILHRDEKFTIFSQIANNLQNQKWLV